jgi:hypothetical protein
MNGSADTTTPRDDRRPDAKPARGAMRWRVPVAAAALVLASGGAFAPWLLSDPARLSRLVAGALPELDGDVSFRAVRIGWLGPIVLEGVGVTPRDGSPAPLGIARVEIDNGLAAIIASLGDLGTVRVAGLEADVVFDAGRRSNLSGLVRSPPEPGRPSARRPPRRSAVRMRLEIEDAIVRIAGPWSPEAWRSDAIDVRATLAPAADGGAGSEWTIEPVALFADARLEPAVAQGVLAYIAPVLAGATRSGGRFSLTIEGAVLPVGRPGDGRVSGALTLHEVVVGPGPLVENLLTSLPVRLPLPPDVRIADEARVAFRLADRQVWHEGLEFGVPLGKPGLRLDIRSAGSVGIDDGSLNLRLELPIPADLPGDRPVVVALAGKSISVGIQGVLGEPRVVFDGSIRQAAGEFVGDLVERLRSGRSAAGPDGEPGQSASGDAAEVIVDMVGDLLGEVARRRAERRAAEENGSLPPPPRRLRERLRGGPGRVPEP